MPGNGASDMATGQLSGVLHQLCKAALLPDGGGMTDGQLLESFLARKDEAAFAALVGRHGPMVWGVCRRVLHNGHDAEDAFQAAFLVLVRKAVSIRRRESVGSWLHGVAYRAALETRAARQRSWERQVSTMPEPHGTMETESWRDLRPLLDRELSGLPDKYRGAVVLCDLEGKSRKDAARQLGIPEGTLSSRLATARRMLARRLARHGLPLSAAALGTVLSQGMASAGLPKPLVDSTVKVATRVAAGHAAAGDGIPVEVAAITEGVIRAMLMTKLKIALAMLMIAALFGTGAFLYEALAGQTPLPPSAAKTAPAAPLQTEPSRYLDLQDKANQKLTDNFHSGKEGNNLADLPTGMQTFADVKFSIGRGVIQLGSQKVKDKPEKVEGIKVGQKFDKLHILHATGYYLDQEVRIGEYVIHYADKSKETIEIVYGKDVIDWYFYPDAKEPTRGKKAWEGQNEPAKEYKAVLRLYVTTWENPHPGKEVVSIDYISTLTDAAPFCVAMTVERKK
jgi:RNA polymerase sigma factor (sigma-70 family)